MNPAANRRITVLASGRGTNLQALFDGIREGHLNAEVVSVISHTPTAIALERARRHGIPAQFISTPKKHENRDEWDQRLADLVAQTEPDLVYLLGWMRVLGPGFIARFPDPRHPGQSRILNLHPALPGELPGQDAILRAFEEYEAGHRKHTGVMVHVVTPEVDVGPVLAFDTVQIPPSLESLEAEVHRLEHRLVLQAARRFFGDEP
jgi:formyltetrahydrofolate-dependent phosphoribosylglycinamide formyltransferase